MAAPSRFDFIDLASIAGVPGLQAVASLASAVHKSIENVKVHRERCQHLSLRAAQHVGFLHDKVANGRLNNDEIRRAADTLEFTLNKINKETIRWGEMGMLRSIASQDTIARDIDKFERDLDFIAKTFAIAVNLEVAHSQDVSARVHERDHEELVGLLHQILSNKEGLNQIKDLQGPQVESLMSTIQQELHRTSTTDDPQQVGELRRGLAEIRNETGIRPPLADLTGEVTRLGDGPAAAGGNADIWKGDWLGDKVALKILRNFGDLSEKTQKRFDKEITIWRDLKHPNVLPLYGLCYFGEFVHMVSPWAHNRELTSYVRKASDANRVKLLRQAADGLAYLHTLSPHIIHGDLRAANILVTENGDALISDFGMARLEELAEAHYSHTSQNTAGAVRWMAPELIDPGRVSRTRPMLTTQTDCWSFGIVCYEVFSGRRPYSHQTLDIHVMKDITNGFLHPRPACEGLSNAVWNLMLDCWQPLPHNRPRLTEVASRLLKVERLRSNSVSSLPNSLHGRQGSTSNVPVRRDPVTSPERRLATIQDKESYGLLGPIRGLDITDTDTTYIFISDNDVSRDPPTIQPTPTRTTKRTSTQDTYWVTTPTNNRFNTSPKRMELPLPSPPKSPGVLSATPPSLDGHMGSLRLTPTSPSFRQDKPYPASNASSENHGMKQKAYTYSVFSEQSHASSGSPPTSMIGLPDVEHSLEMKFSSDGGVIAGTIDGLVNYMIMGSPNPEKSRIFRQGFLTIYPAFTKAEIVLNLLVEQYELACSDRRLGARDRINIRFNVLEVLSQWLASHRIENDDLQLLQRMKGFAQRIREPNPLLVRAENIINTQIQPHIDRILTTQDTVPVRSLQQQMEAKLSQVTPASLARHLTILESRLYGAILPSDCIAYLKKVDGDPMQAITAVRQNTRKLTAWVQKLILKVNEAEDRASKIHYFIAVAEECSRLNNLSSVFAIVMALQSVVISRLKHTRERVVKQFAEQLRRMSEIVDQFHHYATYRRQLKNARGPVIPILQVHLSDLSRGFQGGTSTVPGDGRLLINYSRYEQLLDGIKDSLRYQSPKHQLEADPPVMALVERQLSSMILSKELEQYMEARSLQLLSREQEQWQNHDFALADLGFR